jgi:site-specific DNA-methyltransferase (adenine-specific)
MQRKPYRLYHGDCLDILQSLPENSIDLIFADPPYNLSNDGFTCSNGKKVSVNKGNWDKSKGFEEDYEFHLQWLEACKRVLKDNGTLWLSGTYHSIYQCGHALQKLDSGMVLIAITAVVNFIMGHICIQKAKNAAPPIL